jgi:hypothetical protein
MAPVVTEAIVQTPDIAYKPNYEKYQARSKLRLQSEPLHQVGLPASFPQRLSGDLVWEGDGLADKYDWTFVLSEVHVEELEDALAHFKCSQHGTRRVL